MLNKQVYSGSMPIKKWVTKLPALNMSNPLCVSAAPEFWLDVKALDLPLHA